MGLTRNGCRSNPVQPPGHKKTNLAETKRCVEGSRFEPCEMVSKARLQHAIGSNPKCPKRTHMARAARPTGLQNQTKNRPGARREESQQPNPKIFAEIENKMGFCASKRAKRL